MSAVELGAFTELAQAVVPELHEPPRRSPMARRGIRGFNGIRC
jgi:hypothetical protein